MNADPGRAAAAPPPQLRDKYGLAVKPLPRAALGPGVEPGDITACLKAPAIIIMEPAGRPAGIRRFWYYGIPSAERPGLELEVEYEIDSSYTGMPARLVAAQVATPAARPTGCRWEALGVGDYDAASRALAGPFATITYRALQELVDASDAKTEVPAAAPPRPPAPNPPAVPALRSTPAFEVVDSPLGPIALRADRWAAACAADPGLAALQAAIVDRLAEPRGPDYCEQTGFHEELALTDAVRMAASQPDVHCLYYFEAGDHEIEIVVVCPLHQPTREVAAVLRVPAGGARDSALPPLQDGRGVPIFWAKRSWRVHVTRHPELASYYAHLAALVVCPAVIGQDKSARPQDVEMPYRYYLSPGAHPAAQNPQLVPTPGRAFHWLLNYRWDAARHRVVADAVTGFLNGWDRPVLTGEGAKLWIRKP